MRRSFHAFRWVCSSKHAVVFGRFRSNEIASAVWGVFCTEQSHNTSIASQETQKLTPYDVTYVIVCGFAGATRRLRQTTTLRSALVGFMRPSNTFFVVPVPSTCNACTSVGGYTRVMEQAVANRVFGGWTILTRAEQNAGAPILVDVQ